MDYFFVLRAANKEGFKVSGVPEFQELLRTFGMTRFAKGVMWIIAHVFANVNANDNPNFFLGIKPNEKEGRYILNEVMTGGNFVHYKEEGLSIGKGKLNTIFKVVSHNLHLFTHYPADTIWAPLYFVRHKLWKLKHRNI